MTLRAFYFDLLTAFFAIDIKKCWIVAFRTQDLQHQTAGGTARVLLFDLGSTLGTPSVYWRFFSAERTSHIFG